MGEITVGTSRRRLGGTIYAINLFLSCPILKTLIMVLGAISTSEWIVWKKMNKCFESEIRFLPDWMPGR
jgi:hypothetical protein